jgi:hypothetical protein
VARKAAAANGLSSKVCVAQQDVRTMERGDEVPTAGANVIVFDTFDAGEVPDI